MEQKKNSSAPLGVTPTEQNVILQKLSTLENLLKKKDDHAYRQTSKPLTFKEACAYLGYAPSYLYKLTYRKVIPYYKPTGKIIFFSKAELDEWIYKNRCQNSEISSQNDSSTSLGVTKENEGGSTSLTTKDPNQMEMGFDEQKERRNEGKKKRRNEEIVIEFPLKSRRSKSNLQ